MQVLELMGLWVQRGCEGRGDSGLGEVSGLDGRVGLLCVFVGSFPAVILVRVRRRKRREKGVPLSTRAPRLLRLRDAPRFAISRWR